MQESFNLTVAFRRKNGKPGSIVLSVNQADTIKNIKEKIKIETKVNIENQKIMRDLGYLHDTKTLAHYKINKDTVLLLFCKGNENSDFFDNAQPVEHTVSSNTRYLK